MVAAFDSVGPAGGAGAGHTGATALSWTHTTIGGPCVILVGCAPDNVPTTSPATATCDGSAMTSLGTIASGSGGTTGFLQVFWISGISAGAHTMVVTPNGSTTDTTAGSIAFTGYTGLGTVYSSSTTKTVVDVSNTNGNIIAGFFGCGDVITQAGAPATGAFLNNLQGGSGSSVGNIAGAYAPATGSSVTITWTTSSTAFCSMGVEVQGAPGNTGGGPIRLSEQLAGLQRRRRKNAQRPQFNLGGPNAAISPVTVTARAAVPAASAQGGLPCITGLDPSTSMFFVDQNGNPRLMLVDNPWALVTNAGEWTAGGSPVNWQTEMSNYIASRAAQGFTGLYTTAIGCLDVSGSFQNGNTWDGVTPFVSGGDPSTGLNSTFWTRVDYLVTRAATAGLTVFLNIAYTANGGHGTFDPGGALYNLTGTQYTNYGTALGNRYKNQPNIVWMYGNDYFSGLYDTPFGQIRSAIIATGDTHVMSVHVYPESTSRYDIQTGTGGLNGSTFAFNNAQVNWVYTYNFTYFGIELAYAEAATHGIAQRPAVWGDGYFYDSGVSIPTDQMTRQMAWWAIASGARGLNSGSNDIWPWGSGSPAAVTTGLWWTAEAGILFSAVTALPGWHTLLPDTSSTLVTAGRGTHGTGIATGGFYNGGTDNYVAASVTLGGTLAIIYCAKAFSITIDQTKMAAGYTATWLDPSNGATSAATVAATYNSGTAKGNNAAGEPDWVLILQAPPARAPGRGRLVQGSRAESGSPATFT